MTEDESDGTTAEGEPPAAEPAEEGADGAPDPERAVVLDFLPHGRADDDRPRYEKSPLAQALGESDFRLVELTLSEDADVGIGDRVVLSPPAARGQVTAVRDLNYEELSNGARNELEYVVEEVIDADPDRFVDFYNRAQPVTLRLHQLNLLPGIGKKLRNNVLDQRKREPFADFEDLEERVSGLHRPKEVLVERIIEELRDEDLKYKTFVGRESFIAGEGEE